MENSFRENLKDALCNNDVEFLKTNHQRFSINDKFEDEDNDSLLLYALSDSGSDIYRYLLENKADINALNSLGENVVHSIVFSGKKERLNGIANRNNINHRSNEGATPLLLAISIEKYDIAQTLIELGADVNIGDNENVYPIHMACMSGNLTLVKMLVDKGAILSIKTSKGNLPLALAVNAGYDKIVRFLYEYIYNNG